MKIREATEFAAEVEFGVSQEERVLRRWAPLSRIGRKARGFLRAGRFDDFDYVVFGEDGRVIAYLEIKVRRVPLAKYGDAVFPARKMAKARSIWRANKLPFIAAVEYGCGALVQVDLTAAPSGYRRLTRHDRPGQAVSHVVYGRDKLNILSEGSKQ